MALESRGLFPVRLPPRPVLLALLALGLPPGASADEAPDPDGPERRASPAVECNGRDGRDATVGDAEDGGSGGDCGNDLPVEPT